MLTLTLLSAFLTCLIFPKINLFILAYVSLIPMLFLVNRTESRKKIFLYGFIFGFILQGYFHIWIFQLKVWGPLWGVFLIWLSYSIYLALFYALAFTLLASFKNFSFYELSFPFIWIVFEWLRSFGPIGNTAASLGYSQTANLPILQLASIFGVFGLSFYIVLINVIIYMLILPNLKSIRIKLLLSLVLFILLPYIWGGYYANPSNAKSEKFLKVSIIQGNHGQNFKYNAENRAKIKKDYLALSQKSLTSTPDIIFWPETFLPALNLYDISFMLKLNNFIANNNCAVLFGSPVEDKQKYYNSAVLITPQNFIPQTYLKNVLMPFGEYIPFRFIPKKLGFLLEGEDYSVGQTQKLLSYNKDLKFGGGICLESIYPGFYRGFVKSGADILFVLVNNAWFFKSAAAEEHLQMSILRAVENNRFLVQSSNTGISAIINNRGKVLEKSKLDEQIILSSKVFYGLPHSLYFYLGNIIVYVSFLVIVILGWFLFKKKNLYK